MVPGVNYPDSSPEPSVERVGGASHSTVGGIGTHMVLWALSSDSAVRLWGSTISTGILVVVPTV
jgi:hypothetical protein